MAFTAAAMVAAMAQARPAPDPAAALQPEGAIPGRPERPELVPPRLVGRRSMITQEGRAMLVHALAHIEFNAMNLALDALWRFPELPVEYYTDWLRVAVPPSACTSSEIGRPSPIIEAARVSHSCDR